MKSTYYSLDAQGNTISTYAHANQNNTVSFSQEEKMIYGSSRLGMKQQPINMLVFTDPLVGKDSAHVGYKNYELSNHLGNVLTTVRDVVNGDAANGYWADVSSVSDYSPFGVQLDGRSQSASDYRYGFNNMEKDDEVKGEGNSYDFGARMYDPRVGRFLSLDPKTEKLPYLSPYSFAANDPINLIDKNGENPIHPWSGAEVEISLWYAGLVTYDPTKKNKDKKLYDAANPTTFGLPSPRKMNNHDGSWAEGASEFPADKVLPLTTKQSKTLLAKLHSVDADDFNSACNPCDQAWREAAKSGTYTYISDNLAETDFLHINKSSYEVISVENNVITQITRLTRNSSSDDNKYSVASTTTYEMSKVQKEMTVTHDFGWFGTSSSTYKYDEVTITATVTAYENGSPKGTPKVETKTRNENYNLKE